MTGLKRNIPSLICNENDMRRERKKIRTLMSSAFHAWSNLKEAFNGKVHFEDLKKVADVRWIDVFVDTKIDSINNVSGTDLENVLPQGQIAYLTKRWEAIRETAHKNAAIIGKLYEQYPTGQFHLDKFRKYIVCDNLDEIVEKATSVKIDDKCKELFRLYANCVDDLARLNRYAQEHGCREFDPSDIGKYQTAENFAEMWSIGWFAQKPSDEQLVRRITPQNDLAL